MSHQHLWTRDLSRGRYICECGVIGHTAQNLPGQYRTASQYVKPFLCRALLGSKTTGRHRCGKEAVHVTADRSQSRCAECLAATETRAA